VIVLTFCVLGLFCTAVSADERQKPRVYTNEDLERISALREQTGVASQPGTQAPTRERDEGPQRRRNEEYWRRQLERLRTRLAPAQARASELERALVARRLKAGLRPHLDPRIAQDERRLTELRERIREEEDRFYERARRSGALPGWLR
jgi:hypothetical protein